MLLHHLGSSHASHASTTHQSWNLNAFLLTYRITCYLRKCVTCPYYFQSTKFFLWNSSQQGCRSLSWVLEELVLVFSSLASCLGSLAHKFVVILYLRIKCWQLKSINAIKDWILWTSHIFIIDRSCYSLRVKC